jgi:FMN-dependent NADH-azoreductase
MKNILIINASANTRDSFSRKLSEAFLGHLNAAGQNHNIFFRDLADSQIPHITQRWIEADSKPLGNRSPEDFEVLRTSDSLIAELHQADIIVLATPMYNWSIPSSLKAYLDQVMRFNETFIMGSRADGKRYRGLLENKVLFLLFARGSQGYGKGERNEHMDFQSKYLQMVFGIMGIEKIYELAINGTKRNNRELDGELTALKEQIAFKLGLEFGEQDLNNPNTATEAPIDL